MPQPPARLALLDACRGIAALSVVVFHLYEQNLLRHAAAPFPEPFHTVFRHGYLGVYIFFVLSGFVIAHSLRNMRMSASVIGRFALRRSLRLDPPYWATIAVAIVLLATAGRAMKDPPPVPSASEVVAHVFYVQQFLGMNHIVGVFWTLCLEIQFYLVYAVLLLGTQRLRVNTWALFGPLLALAVVVNLGVIGWGHALFVWAWPYFFLGAATAWHFDRAISTPVWVLVVIATALVGFEGLAEMGVAISTALVVFIAGQRRTATGATWLEQVSLGRTLQYLGTLSYSLYLTHLLVGAKSARVGIRLLGAKPLSYPYMIALLIGCVGVSIVAAHLMYVAVERPAHRFSRRVALQPRA